MFLPIYLAMTSQEIAQFEDISSTLCYMSCHFSLSGTGLTNIPNRLIPHSLLCIDDSTPITSHDPKSVCEQIQDMIDNRNIDGILLDFQRDGNPFAHKIIESILEYINCPVAVSHIYAKGYSCPVFLPPLPLRIPLLDHLSPWAGRDIWLEISTVKQMATVKPDCFAVEDILNIPMEHPHFTDTSLLCHYSTHVKPDRITFYIHRTAEDLMQLQLQAQKLGVSKFVGLWQQLQQFYS